ncbi:MAG: NAD(P)H-binding protein [Proteiniphilum sp.]|uniref:SDR family oxidoreductase n=1 Tax=Proteiniphilum sp. TaxID=1926877 RepID=UPI002AB93C90|nr:SDR family oxidoreductase [Proteiniphilum sp.]MDY9918629.1 NAD(P)H-binding protein [Proteiniphilum sp.]
MNILIFGGTGAMGAHLIDILSTDKQNQIYVTSRAKRKSHDNIHYFEGNAHDVEFIKPILEKKWDAIIDFMVYSSHEFNGRAALFLESTSHYIFLSSARVYANSNEKLTENSPRLLDSSDDLEYHATDEYALSKARQEDILRKSGKKNWTIIRPYITYSSDRLQLGVLEKEEWLYRALHGRTIVFSKDICTKFTTLTFGYDVSKGIAALIKNEKAYGEAFHITNDNEQSWENILDIYRKVLTKHLKKTPKVKFVSIDSMEKIHPAKYQIHYDRLYNRLFDNKKINEFINTQSFTPIEEGLTACLEQFLRSPCFKNINWKNEAIKDRISGEFTPLQEIKGGKQIIKYLIFRFFELKN